MYGFGLAVRCPSTSLFVRLAVTQLLAPELLLVGIDAMLQAAQLLCQRVGQMDLVEVVGRHTLAVDLDHARLHADNRRVGRHLLQHDRIRADAAVIANVERTEHLCARRNKHIVANRRVALAGVVSGAAEGHAMVNRAIVTDLGGFADDNAHAVVNEQAAANGRARVDLDAGHMARKLRKPAREEKPLMFVQPVRLPVQDQRVKALIQQEYLERGARGRVAVAD